MKAYYEPTQRGEMRRMGRVTQAAPEAYGLTGTPLKLCIDNNCA
jgi:hypothetical protein